MSQKLPIVIKEVRLSDNLTIVIKDDEIASEVVANALSKLDKSVGITGVLFSVNNHEIGNFIGLVAPLSNNPMLAMTCKIDVVSVISFVTGNVNTVSYNNMYGRSLLDTIKVDLETGNFQLECKSDVTSADIFVTYKNLNIRPKI